MKRRAHVGRVKIHRSYTIDELARVTGTHKNTVRSWIKKGLPTVDDRRPAIMLGSAVKAFHAARKAARKRPCPAGHLFCLKCREPRRPALGMVDCLPATETVDSLRGLCPVCATLMHRRVSVSKFGTVAATLDVQFPQGQPRLTEMPNPSLNSDSRKDP